MQETSFKHLTKDNCKALLEKGEVFIGNYKLYREIENSDIVDPTEGYLYSTKFYSEKEGDKIVKNESTGEFLTPDHPAYGFIKFEKTAIGRKISYADSYIYCTSISSKKGLFRGHDSCVEIINQDFYNHIGKALYKKKIIEPSGRGYLISYFENKMVDFRNNIPAYWVKDKSFEDAQEYRFVFKTICKTKEERLEPIILNIPELIPCLKLIR